VGKWEYPERKGFSREGTLRKREPGFKNVLTKLKRIIVSKKQSSKKGRLLTFGKGSRGEKSGQMNLGVHPKNGLPGGERKCYSEEGGPNGELEEVKEACNAIHDNSDDIVGLQSEKQSCELKKKKPDAKGDRAENKRQ